MSMLWVGVVFNGATKPCTQQQSIKICKWNHLGLLPGGLPLAVISHLLCTLRVYYVRHVCCWLLLHLLQEPVYVLVAINFCIVLNDQQSICTHFGLKYGMHFLLLQADKPTFSVNLQTLVSLAYKPEITPISVVYHRASLHTFSASSHTFALST